VRPCALLLTRARIGERRGKRRRTSRKGVEEGSKGYLGGPSGLWALGGSMERTKVTLGGDPEFELIVGGEVVAAEKLLLGRKVPLPWGVIGEDGSGGPIELRPLPSADPEALVANVGRLILSVPRALGGFPSTICEEHPIGGHVHIGGVPSGEQERLVEVIDGLLGDLFHSLSGETRLRAGYGRRGDWRSKPWGFEYRTPPASLWSHPGVALVFLRAIKWVVEKFLSGEEPLKDPVWPEVRASAERAAEFVRKHEGRLHWGAWRRLVKIHWQNLRAYVYLGGETDDGLCDDLRAMCARIGLPFVRVLPLWRSRGDFASNVPGYGELPDDVEPYSPGGELGLSWRFRNDPEFRRAELPRLEEALARILEGVEDIGQDGGRLVKEAVAFAEADEGLGEAEVHDDVRYVDDLDDDRYASPFVCGRCGTRVVPQEAFRYDNVLYCEECFFLEHDFCLTCGHPILRGEALTVDGILYCQVCYGHRFDREGVGTAEAAEA